MGTDSLSRVVWKVSLPIMFVEAAETFDHLIDTLFLSRVGTSALAIANIVYTCFIVFWVPTEGFAETTCSMVSQYIGKNRAHRIGELLRSAIGGALLATVPFISLALLAPQWHRRPTMTLTAGSPSRGPT